MQKFDSTRFTSVGPIFKVTCSRAKQSLDAEVLVVMMSKVDQPEFDFHIEDESGHVDSSRIYYNLKSVDPDAWS